jgi:hypothetical protein
MANEIMTVDEAMDALNTLSPEDRDAVNNAIRKQLGIGPYVRIPPPVMIVTLAIGGYDESLTEELVRTLIAEAAETWKATTLVREVCINLICPAE